MNTVILRLLDYGGTLPALFVCALTGCSLMETTAESSDMKAAAQLGTLQTHQEALTMARTISDPIFRASAVQKWVEVHRAELVPDDARVLCDTLSRESADHCWYIYSAAHLR